MGDERISEAPITSRLALRNSFLASVLLGLLICGWYWLHRPNPRNRWAREVALPLAIRLADEGKGPRLLFSLRAQQAIPDDPVLSRIRREISHPIAIRTNPAGATIWVKAYEEPNAEWLLIGDSSIENFQLPLGYFRWRVANLGSELSRAQLGFQSDTVEFTLDAGSRLVSEMVHIPNGDFQFNSLDPVRIDDYWLDEYEVTNRQFKKFVEMGGYRSSQYWKQEFIRAGRISFRTTEAMRYSATRRAGPGRRPGN